MFDPKATASSILLDAAAALDGVSIPGDSILSIHIDDTSGLEVLLGSRVGAVIAAAVCDLNAHTAKEYRTVHHRTVHHRAPIRGAAGTIVWVEDVKPDPVPATTP